MNRFFVEKINPQNKYITLTDPAQLHHLRDVLRIRPKEKVAVFDGVGNEYIVSVSEIKTAEAKLEIKDKRKTAASGINITVACAIPKNVKMDDIVDKLTQLGVDCVIPLETERVIVRLDRQKKLNRLERWKKIVQSATKQSQRSRFMEIEPVSSFKEAILISKDFDLKLIPTLEGERLSLKEVFNRQFEKIKKVIIFIGPEGDFSPAEVSLAKKEGFLPVSLGNSVLRVDTAAIAIAGFIKLNEAH